MKVAYGLPGFAGAAMGLPIAVHMTKFYADTVGVALGFIAFAQAFARALDAITDPLMGWLSDRTNTRWGRRRIYMAIGAPLTGIAFYLLFSPPANMGATAAGFWFMLAFTGYFLFHTVYVIPHYALGPEMTLDYHERSSLFAYRDGITLAGTAIAAAAPAYFIGWIKGWGIAQAESERIIFMWFSVFMATFLMLSYWHLCYRVPENPDYYTRKANPLVPGLRHVMRNRPFIILLACYLVSSISGAMPGILMPFYMQYNLGVDNWVEWMGVSFLLGYCGGVISLPGWLRLARRFGKKPIWIVTYLTSGFMFLGIFILPVFVEGMTALYFAIVLFGIGALGAAAGAFLGPSIQADVIDYDELYTGKRREAQYGALWSIVTKFVVIPSSSVPLAVLGAVGFQPNVEQTEVVKWTILVLFSLVPAVITLTAMVLAFRFPINEAIHREILNGIEKHKRGEPATDPLTGRRIDPPDNRGLDEETGWYLDHFSAGELQRTTAQGPSRLSRDTATALGISSVVCLLSIVYVAIRLGDLSTPPDLYAVLGILIAGVSLTAACFHGLRFQAARNAGTIQTGDVRIHLDIAQRLSQRKETSE